MPDKPPVWFLVWEKDPLSADPESHQSDEQEDHEVHHVL